MPMRHALPFIALALSAPAGAVEFHHPEGPFVMVHHCTCRFDARTWSSASGAA